jgi:lipopolysaccharide transport system ATP-binding protein
MEHAVRVEGISKLYRIGARRDPRTARETVTETLFSAFRRRVREARDRDLWALRDVSFDVGQGEAIGIVGQNGAGKSTLLKILSRITEPTSGRIRVLGRVSSLLEVGTGFHAELTGRENVQLNGAILGMTRREIRSRFDDIVGFAEVERFIDTPVKYYSSGMYMRLAFAIAAHLEPEILVVDEVLAVGDAAFQAKCLRKMNDVATGGRTVLFVSHNMPAVKALCQRAVWLKAGKVVDIGESEAVVNHYLQQATSLAGLDDVAQRIAELPPDPVFRLLDVTVVQEGKRTSNLLNGIRAEIEIVYEVLEAKHGLHVYFDLYDLEDTFILASLHNGTEPGLPLVMPGRYRSRAILPADFLAARPYEIRVGAAIHNDRMLLPSPIRVTIDVQASGIVNRAYAGYATSARLAPLLEWETEVIGDQ